MEAKDKCTVCTIKSSEEHCCNSFTTLVISEEERLPKTTFSILLPGEGINCSSSVEATQEAGGNARRVQIQFAKLSGKLFYQRNQHGTTSHQQQHQN